MKSQSEQKESQSKWSAADLCLPIYLDQLIVFDMLAVLERIVKLMELAKVFQNPSTTQAVPKRGKISNNQHPSIANPQEEMYQQLRNFHEQMTKSDSIEVKGKSVISPEISVVISMNRNSFVKNESEFIGNIFTIFGKVANVITSNENGSINLLSRTPLAGFNNSEIQKMFNRFDEAKEKGIDLPEVITEVEGPALQIIPIAAFL